MSETVSHVDDWREYFRSKHRTEIQELGDAYPERRSLYVDLIDVYTFDADLVRDVFDAPARALSDGTRALREMSDISGPLYVRPTNNPQQRPIEGIHARYLHELVTVNGVVETVAERRARAVTAVYECVACDSTYRRSSSGIKRAPQQHCVEYHLPRRERRGLSVNSRSIH